MGFKKILGAVAIFTVAAFARNLERENYIGMSLARPGLNFSRTTAGTRTACRNGQIINNTCITTSADIAAAVSEGYTCHSVDLNGETRITCAISNTKCLIEEVTTKNSGIKVEQEPVKEHYCQPANT